MEEYRPVPEKYMSAADTWLVVLAIGLPLFPGLIGALLVSTPEQELVGWLILGLSIAAGVILYFNTVPVYYSFGENALIIHVGMTSGYSIPYPAISAVTPTHRIRFAPAWSLQRLQIDYQDMGEPAGYVLISPQQRERFCRELEDHCYHLELFADGVTLRERKTGSRKRRKSRKAPRTIHGVRVNEDTFHESGR